MKSPVQQISNQIRKEGLTPEMVHKILYNLNDLERLIKVYGDSPCHYPEHYAATVQEKNELQEIVNSKIIINITYLQNLLGNGPGSRALQELKNILTIFLGISVPEVSKKDTVI